MLPHACTTRQRGVHERVIKKPGSSVMPDKSIREFVREGMHKGNGGRLHLHRLFDATRKAVAFSYVQRIATEWFRDGGHLLKRDGERLDDSRPPPHRVPRRRAPVG